MANLVKFLISSAMSIVIGLFAFKQAAKIGRREDEITALKDADILSLTNFSKKK